MHLPPHILLATTLFCLLRPSVLHAEPVTITGGFLLATGRGEVSPRSTVTGTNGFSISTNVAVELESFGLPALDCGSNACFPGESLFIGGFLAGDSGLFRTMVTLNGAEYAVPSGPEDPTALILNLEGFVVLPEFGDFNPLTITTQFVLNSGGGPVFAGPSRFIDSAGISTRLVGRGTATISLVPGTEPELPQYWAVDQLRYDFAPVPEPATLLLLGSGLVAAFCRPRRP